MDARRCTNGTDRATEIAQIAQQFLNTVLAGLLGSQVHQQHGALYRVVPDAVQGLLAL